MTRAIDIKYNKETGTLEVRETMTPNDKLMLDSARAGLERIFEDYLMRVFKIETMNLPRGLSIVALRYLYPGYAPDCPEPDSEKMFAVEQSND